MKKLNLATSALVVAMGMAVSTALADNNSTSDSIQTQLNAVAAPELPVQAAKIVAGAKADSLQATTEAVIAAASSSKPAAMVSVVSAIAHQNSGAAAFAAAKAATLQPKQAAFIARAAASAAPSQAATIVAAVCKAVPTKYSVVATAVAQVVPTAAKEILVSVGEAVPALKSYIDQASATYQGSTVGVILAEVQRLIDVSYQANSRGSDQFLTASAAGPGASPALIVPLPPPVKKPPITPAPTTPTEISHTNSVEVPPGGGRDYSGG